MRILSLDDNNLLTAPFIQIHPPLPSSSTSLIRGQPKFVKAPEIKHRQRCVAPLTCVTQLQGRDGPPRRAAPSGARL